MPTTPTNDQFIHDTEAVLGSVGPRLRDARQTRRMTLSEVAERTGISISTLSRLESGQRRPNLDLLLPLAHVYQVALDDLIGAPPTGDPRVHVKPIRNNGTTFVPLTRGGAPVEAFKMVLPPQRIAPKPSLRRHGGYEWLYVLTGAIDLTLGIGTATTRVRAGEAAEFDTRTPHALTSADQDKAAEVLALFSPSGTHLHVRQC
ncbi:helix-turn-helix domain-containing protein [Streptomyces hyaluromycini]|uniref:helix-turn-helix domain-containing protein n=1 Tax=Streptomyces hyaluromycini TaxID=1377993 RepID=UPI000B5D05A6|nr:XRE family transcriptional regulator [Streptomyces hyaluromycini]